MTNRLIIPQENTVLYPRINQFPGSAIGNFTFEHQIGFTSIDFQVICHDPLLKGS